MKYFILLFMVGLFFYLFSVILIGKLAKYIKNVNKELYREIKFKSIFGIPIKNYIYQDSDYIFSVGLVFFKKLIIGFNVDDKYIKGYRFLILLSLLLSLAFVVSSFVAL